MELFANIARLIARLIFSPKGPCLTRCQMCFCNWIHHRCLNSHRDISLAESKNAEIWISKHEPTTETTIKIFLQNAFKKICAGKLSADYYQSICGGVYFLVKSHTFSILFSTHLDVSLRWKMRCSFLEQNTWIPQA